MKNTRSFFLAISLIVAGSVGYSQKVQTSYNKLLHEISNHVKNHFYIANLDSIEWNNQVRKCGQKLSTIKTLDEFDQIINDLLSTLNTSHTYFYSRNNPKRYQLLGIFHQMFDQKDTSLFIYEGIGIDTKIIENKTYITAAYDGFPASEAELSFGDQILSINNESFHRIKSFKNKADTNVSIEYIRNNKLNRIEVPVILIDGRTMFDIAFQSSIKQIDRGENKIGYAHMWSYAGIKYQNQLRETLLWGKLSNCDALILDLRDGWGGADINYLNLFRIPIAKITSTFRNDLVRYYSGVWEKPVVLLVNQGSTSGKELLAYGFEKLHLGKIIGEKTAGAVMGGRVFKLSSGDILYLAVQDIQVDGKRLEGIGISPHVHIERSTNSSNDEQLERAIIELTSQINYNR